jgi:hypothetical protein
MLRRLRRSVLEGLLFAACCCGCSNDPYRHIAEVTGTVTCNGQPAAGGIITFTPIDNSAATGRNPGEPGRPSSAMVQEDGTFRLRLKQIGGQEEEDGALIGDHVVSFQGPLTERRVVSGMQKMLPPEAQKELEERFNTEPVFPPLKCGTTIGPAQVTVNAEGNHLEFTLSGEPVETQTTRNRRRTPGEELLTPPDVVAPAQP